MKSEKNVSRITIDIPEEDHKKFKAMAAIQGKSMREIIVESIQRSLLESQPAIKKTVSEKKNRQR